MLFSHITFYMFYWLLSIKSFFLRFCCFETTNLEYIVNSLKCIAMHWVCCLLACFNIYSMFIYFEVKSRFTAHLIQLGF